MAVPTDTNQPFCGDAASLALTLGADASVAGADVLASGDAVGDPEAEVWVETAERENIPPSLSKVEKNGKKGGSGG